MRISWTPASRSTISKSCWNRGPRSIRIATLLDKPSRRKVDLQADYIGFSVPDEFVIGYGLDYDEKYRNLPYIGILKRGLFRISRRPAHRGSASVFKAGAPEEISFRSETVE